MAADQASARRQRPARAPLSREAIVDAALRVLDREGAAALTLGRIPTGPNVVRWAEWTLALMRGAGIPSLPADQFPNVLATLDELFSGGPDERFELGLDVILRGLATYAKP